MSTDNVTPIKPPDEGEPPARRAKRRSQGVAQETLRFREAEEGGITADLLLVALKYQFYAIQKILDTEQDATVASYLALAGQQLVASLEERRIDT
jgi:hypothetical protein